MLVAVKDGFSSDMMFSAPPNQLVCIFSTVKKMLDSFKLIGLKTGESWVTGRIWLTSCHDDGILYTDKSLIRIKVKIK